MVKIILKGNIPQGKTFWKVRHSLLNFPEGKCVFHPYIWPLNIKEQYVRQLRKDTTYPYLCRYKDMATRCAESFDLLKNWQIRLVAMSIEVWQWNINSGKIHTDDHRKWRFSNCLIAVPVQKQSNWKNYAYSGFFIKKLDITVVPVPTRMYSLVIWILSVYSNISLCYSDILFVIQI